MASSARGIWTEVSEDLARITETVGTVVVALQGKEGHAVSGVLWQSGIVVTANHAARQDDLTVLLPGGQSTAARVKGRDPSTDLAIFTIDSQAGTLAVRGDAAKLRVGNLVLALARTRRGNLTASSGIISGLMEAWQTWQGGQIDRFIRPDLSLYRGYSGGPLVNDQGEIVGVNTSGLRRGTPITIPTSTVTRVVDELLAKGHIARPYIGVALQSVALPEGLMTKLSITSAYGLLVVHLESDGPAGRAGLMLGDIVVEIAGEPVTQFPRVHNLVSKQQVGRSVVLGIVRSGERQQISVTLGDRFDR